ncbi:MAG: class I tRNA ligase family protein, partial [Elusimicrobiota bacterium]|jgi:isoleucyl-tRNA synthetase|nr:class I tRNA ligase family protein [Elusimicrobiota bacterium]
MREIDKYALSRLNNLIENTTEGFETYEFHKTASLINNFCAVFLSGFYLDALKDILYCDDVKSANRLSTQSAMFEILINLTKMTSPILSFTCEETWKEIIKISPGQPKSVFLSDYPASDKKKFLSTEELGKWENILKIRQAVLEACENLRKEKVIGSNLEAHLDIKFGKKYASAVKDKENLYLAMGNWDIKLTSDPSDDVLEVSAAKSSFEKCLRCWRHIDGIKNGLCHRCAEVVNK